jgi:hypothetical protein
MPRIRTIKPTHVSDKQLTKVSLQAHLLWVLSWCFSDDEGVFENDPLLLKSNLFPRRTDIRVEQIEQWLGQLVKARFIIPFEYKNESYFLHRTFKTHQKIDRPQGSKIDPTTIRRILDEQSTISSESSALYSIVEDSKGEESNESADAEPKVVDLWSPVWGKWVAFKKSQFGFRFKSVKSEEIALRDLKTKSGNDIFVANAIVDNSIASGYKGLFVIKGQPAKPAAPTASRIPEELHQW